MDGKYLSLPPETRKNRRQIRAIKRSLERLIVLNENLFFWVREDCDAVELCAEKYKGTIHRDLDTIEGLGVVVDAGHSILHVWNLLSLIEDRKKEYKNLVSSLKAIGVEIPNDLDHEGVNCWHSYWAIRDE